MNDHIFLLHLRLFYSYFLRKKNLHSHYYSPRTKNKYIYRRYGSSSLQTSACWSWSTILIQRRSCRGAVVDKRFTIPAFTINKHWPNPGLKKRILFQYVLFTLMNQMPELLYFEEAYSRYNNVKFELESHQYKYHINISITSI